LGNILYLRRGEDGASGGAAAKRRGPLAGGQEVEKRGVAGEGWEGWRPGEVGAGWALAKRAVVFEN